MILRHLCYVFAIPFVILALTTATTAAAPVAGTSLPLLPTEQFMAMTVTIDDTKTTFSITGPDFSWFSFGFDTITMAGYSLIIEGTDASRTVIEQNLLGIGNPGSPQPVQNASILSTLHDDANDLTTVVIERLNNTGDPDDAVFSTSITELNVIAAYDAFATPESPNGLLSFHGSDGFAFDKITFAIVPEPTTIGLIAVAALLGFSPRKLRRQ